MDTNEFLAQAKAKLGSYRAVAKHLGVTEGFISNVRNGWRKLPSYHHAKLAELLEMNPAQAFIEAEIKAAEGKDEAASLKRWFQKVAAFIAAVFVVAGGSGSLTPISKTQAATGHPGSGHSSQANVSRTIQCVQRTDERQPRSARIRRWLRGQAETLRAKARRWLALTGQRAEPLPLTARGVRVA